MQVPRWRRLLTLRNSFFPSAHSALFHSTSVSLAMWKNKLNMVPGQGKYPSKVPGQGKDSTKQRIAVSTGMEGEEKLLQIDVYNQGMLRTEICNNWMKKGVCLYGNHCKFAHGLCELRPVIRHPRYKTEVCRMFLAGKTCPYGNRCHFRHSLTEQDRCEFAIGLQELRFAIRHPR